MSYQNGDYGFHPRPLNTGENPFPNPRMFRPFHQRRPPFRPPMMRGMPRRGGSPGRMMRPGYRSAHPTMMPHQPGVCPPFMKNMSFLSSQPRNNEEFFTNENVSDDQHDSGNITTYGQSSVFNEGNQNDDSFGERCNQEIFSCDSCDRNFPSETAFHRHMSEHKVCGLDGCTFSAHVKIVEKHIEMQHASGIFERMGNLDSPENIAKWIEERKARFPSKENIEKRHMQQEELWKKGIRIGERKNKLGRDKSRMVHKDPQSRKKESDDFFRKKQEKRDKVIKKFQVKLLIDEKSDWNGNLPPFKGMNDLFSDKDEEKFNISDDEDDFSKTPTKIEDLVKVNSSLSALMGYGTDYSDEEDVVPTEIKTNQISEKTTQNACDIKENEVGSDEDAPLELKIQRSSTNENSTITNEPEKPKEPSKKSRKRKSNNKSRENSNKKIKSEHIPNPFSKQKNYHLKRILDEDIRRERNIILQCVLHTVKNHFYMK